MALTAIKSFFVNIFVLTWDLWLNIVNLFTPNLKVGKVIPKDHPGFGGHWPEFIAPTETSSRGSCPALNAMANHGILPRDGKNFSFKELNEAVRNTYNFSPSFCFFVPNFAAKMLKKDYSKDRIDLADIDLHNGIEHDASLTRHDVAIVSDQSKPDVALVEALLASATGQTKDGDFLLTTKDLSKYSAQRRVAAKETNPDFSLSTFHKFFGSSNSSTMLTIFGGHVGDLRSILLEERIPEGWEPRIRARKGLTMAKFNVTAIKIELGINEKKVKQEVVN
ncbi:Chloroperoxidase [Mycena floridula]|nr:Chloroperoxidase [Mycena floridula]